MNELQVPRTIEALACQLLSDIPEGLRTVSDTAPFLLHSDTVATAPKKVWILGLYPSES